MFDRRVSRPALKAPVALTTCPMRFRQHSTCATRSIWSFKVGQEWSSWISAVSSSLVIMMPSLPCQQFMGCRCSFSWDNAGRKSTWVAQMPLGEELNQLDEVQNMVSTRSCGTKKGDEKHVCRERVYDYQFSSNHVWTSSWARHRHAYTTPNALGVAGWMFQLTLTPHCPTCFVQSQARHFPPSKSSSRIPAHELVAQMVLEIIGWDIPVIGVTPSSLNRTDRQVKDEKKAVPRKRRGETQHHPKEEETKQHHRTEERVNAASPKGGEGRQHHRTGEGKRATWLKKGGGDQAAPPNRRQGKKQPHPKEEEDNTTKQEKEKQQHHPQKEETKRHHATDDKGKKSSTQSRRRKATPNRKKGKQQHHPKKERRRNMNKSESICHSLCSCGRATAQWRVRVSRCPSRDQMCMSRQGWTNHTSKLLEPCNKCTVLDNDYKGSESNSTLVRKHQTSERLQLKQEWAENTEVDPNERSHTVVVAQKKSWQDWTVAPATQRVGTKNERMGGLLKDTKQRWYFIKYENDEK